MSHRSLIASIRHAIDGIRYVFSREQNFRIHVFFSTLVLLAAWVFPLRPSEHIVVILLIMFILVLELINSAIEKFADIVKPRLHDQIKVVKDIMAGTVLIAVVGSGILGILIFFPYLIELFAQQ